MLVKDGPLALGLLVVELLMQVLNSLSARLTLALVLETASALRHQSTLDIRKHSRSHLLIKFAQGKLLVSRANNQTSIGFKCCRATANGKVLSAQQITLLASLRAHETHVWSKASLSEGSSAASG